jgi:hypothetical protein
MSVISRKMNKEESLLWKKFDSCRTRKCSKIIKKKEKERNIFEKEQTKKCPQKRAKAFYNCSSKFYNGSKLEKLSKDIVKCAKNKCYTQKNKLDKYRNKQTHI